MAHFKVGEKVLTNLKGKVLSVKETLAKVKAGEPLTTWQEAKITDIITFKHGRKCMYGIELVNGKTTQGTVRNLRKIKVN